MQLTKDIGDEDAMELGLLEDLRQLNPVADLVEAP